MANTGGGAGWGQREAEGEQLRGCPQSAAGTAGGGPRQKHRLRGARASHHVAAVEASSTPAGGGGRVPARPVLLWVWVISPD